MTTLTKTIAVIGAGSWGTALAILLANNGYAIKLWSHEAHHVNDMRATRVNNLFLPGIQLPDNIELYDNLAETIKDIEDILIVVPSHAFRSVVTEIKPNLAANAKIAWGTKGMDTSSGELFDQIAAKILGPTHPIAILSGPSFALDVAAGLPAAVTIASPDASFAEDLAAKFNAPNFRVYTSTDMTGVELCGVVKNILAIAAGISDGLGLGASALSGLITRGLAEMQRLGVALGAKPETFLGLAGVGDLILTCTDDKSRNRRFGKAIASGKTNDEAVKQIGQVVEGVYNLKAIYTLIQKMNINMPITEEVYRVVCEGLSPQTAVENLFARKPKAEGK
jgi:glycerol-3-phosphate dehydrogenase (NAD(P)+)